MADENVNQVLSSVFSNTELMEKISGIIKNKKGESAEDALPEIISAITCGLIKSSILVIVAIKNHSLNYFLTSLGS